METLVIKDLMKCEELDHKAMTAVLGGIIGGTKDCGGFHAGMTLGQAIDVFVCKGTMYS
jgi:hypothetical protein